MSITVVISAQVSDFDLWRSKFDGLENQRIEAGINAKGINGARATLCDTELSTLSSRR